MKSLATPFLFLFLLLPGTHVFAQAWSPTNGPVGGDVRKFMYSSGGILAGTMGGGIFRLTLNKWHVSNDGLSGYALFVSDFARDDSAIYIATFDGVYRTTDYGVIWEKRNTGIPPLASILSVEYHEDFLYAGLDWGGVYRSSNSGLSWIPVNNNLDTTIAVSSMTHIGEVVLIGTHGLGVFFTEDYGNNWTSLSTGIPAYQEYIISLYSTAGNVYAGIWNYGIWYISLLGGWWQPGNSGLTDAAVYDFTHVLTTMYCATDGGVHRSTNWGANWVLMNNGLRNRRTRAIVPDGIDILAGTYGAGIWKNTGSAMPWYEYNNGMNASVISHLDHSDPYDGKVYVSTFGHGLFTRDTMGGAWTEITTALSDEALEINRFYSFGDSIYLATDAGLYYSTNKGQDWDLHDWGIAATAMTALDFRGDTVIASTWNAGTYISYNFGSFWTKMNYGFPPPTVSPAGDIYPKIPDMQRMGDSLFLAMEPARIFRKNSGTGLWDSLQTTGLDLLQITELDGIDSVLYAAGYGGVYYSTDLGMTWQPDTLGLGYASVRTFRLAHKYTFEQWNHAQVCTFDGRLFIQDSMFGVWRQEDLGNNGFVIDHIADAKNSWIGMYGRGVWTNLAIPVELTVFRGVAEDEHTNLLEWETASETNNAGFEVLRSFEGRSFEARGFVSGVGTTNKAAEYRFRDATDQSAWYKLKQVDFDGSVSYSHTIRIHRQPAAGRFDLSAYPNPFSAQTTITFTQSVRQPVTVRVSDVLGRTVYEHAIPERGSGFVSFTWDGVDTHGAASAAGVYNAVAMTEDGEVIARARIIKR